jgi:hypothetical protein
MLSGMAASSSSSVTPRVVRLSEDPADSDENAAPTKVGPMSKAFIDQMMFKAQLAESSVPPPRSERRTSPPPESCVRTVSSAPLRDLSGAAEMLAPARVPVLSDEEGQLPFEATLRLEPSALQALASPATPAAPHAQPSAPAQTLPRVNVSPWMLAPAPASRPASDHRLAIEVAVCLGTIAAAITGVVVFLFP